VTITHNLVSVDLLRGVITDTHFRQRDRMGRLMGFMGRVMKDNGLASTHPR
jgi:cyanophycinase-like exopeptidase